AAVTVDRPHGAVGVADLGAQRSGHGESHGAQSTGVDEGAGALVVDELGGPHLVLAHARDVGGLWADHLTEAFDDVLRGQAFVGGLVVALGVGGLQAFELVPPGLVVALTALFLVTAHGHDQAGGDFSGITDDGHFRVAVAGDLSGGDVGVDELGPGSAGDEAAGNTVVEAGPQGDDEVGLLQG